MTLHEIEETLATLSSRHKGLDEGMLVTLLLAGGWEKKDIEEATLLFRNGGRHEVPLVAMPNDDLPLLEPEADIDHRLLAHNPDAPVTPVSLMEEKKVSAKDELPHNLPLRPFETSENIWPFSRYKEVFYGEDEVKLQSVPVPEPKMAMPATPAPSPAPVVFVPEPVPEPPKIQTVSFRPEVSQPSRKTSSKGEDKLVLTAMLMLLLILFLLGYMYSNGRF